MPFCVVNGVTIPTAKGGQVANNEMGQRTQAYDGTAQIDVRNRKRVWTFKTKPITPDRAVAIVGMVQGNGLYMPYDVDAFATNGFAAQSGTTAYFMSNTAADGTTPVYDEFGNQMAKYGASSVQVDRGTTNLLTQAQAQGTSLTNVSTAGSATASIDTAHFWEGTTSFKAAVTGTSGQLTLSTGYSLTSSTPIVCFSCYVFSSIPQTYTLRVRTLAGATASANFVHPGGLWMRMAVYSALGGSLPSNILCDILQSAGPLTFWVDGCQLETNTLGFMGPTAWQNPFNGARAAESLAYTPNIVAPTGFTYSAWMAGGYPTPSGSAQVLLNVAGGGSGSRPFFIEIDFSSTSQSTLDFLSTAAATGSTTPLTTTLSSAVLGGWTHIVATYFASPPSGLPTKCLYVNGVLVASQTAAQTSSSFTSYQVGNANGGFNFNGRIDDLQLLPYPVDQNWVSGVFAAGVANGPTPYMNLSGTDVNDYPSVIVSGEAKSEEYIGFQDPTVKVWRPNNRVVDLTLTEV